MPAEKAKASSRRANRLIKRHRARQEKRKCLRCGRMFPSDWIGNRICGNCREINANVNAPTAADKSIERTARRMTR